MRILLREEDKKEGVNVWDLFNKNDSSFLALPVIINTEKLEKMGSHPLLATYDDLFKKACLKTKGLREWLSFQHLRRGAFPVMDFVNRFITLPYKFEQYTPIRTDLLTRSLGLAISYAHSPENQGIEDYSNRVSPIFRNISEIIIPMPFFTKENTRDAREILYTIKAKCCSDSIDLFKMQVTVVLNYTKVELKNAVGSDWPYYDKLIE